MPELSLLKSLFQRFPTVSTVTDEEGNVLFCTRQAQEMFAQFGTRARNQNIDQLFDDPSLWQKITEADGDTPMTAKLKGSSEIVNLQVEQIPDIEIKRYLIHFDMADIIERIPLLDEHAKELIVVLRPDGAITDVSPSCARFTGFNADELRGRNLNAFLHPDKQANLNTEFSRQLKSGPVIQQYTYRFQKKDGAYIWLEAEHEIILDSEGQPLYLTIHANDITDQINSQTRFAELKQRYIEIFEKIDEGIVYQDSTGAITSANQAAQDILGLTLDQLQGRTSMHPEWKAIHEDGSDYPGETHPAMMALKEGKTMLNKMMGVYHPEDQRYVWIRVNSYPLFNEDKKTPVAVYTTFTDLTTEYQKTQELAESESLVRTLFDNAFQFLGVLNPDGTMIDANETGLKFLGLTKEEVIGAYLWNTPEGVLSEVTKERLRRGVETAAKGKFVRFDFELTGVNGESITLDFSLRPVKNNKGEVTVLIPEGRDVTIRKELKKQIDRYNSLLVSIVESVPSILIFTNTEGRILECNKGANDLFDLTLEEITKMNINDLLTEPQTIDPLFSDLFSGDLEVQTHIERVEGQSIPVRLLGTNVVTKETGVAGRLFMLEDISEHLEAERLRNEFTDQLSAKVNERTAELETAKLELERALAVEKELNKLKTHFVLSTSHQFRTPLTIIQSYAEVLAQLSGMIEGAPSEKFIEYSNKITEQVKRTTNLMDDIMLLGKVTSGAVNPAFESVDLISTMEKLIGQYDDTQSSHRLKLRSHGKNRRVNVDRKLTEEAMNNLISNALKYSKEDVEIDVHFHPERCDLDVRDHGIGVKKEDQDSLFQPFFRSNEAMGYSGTGLGLAIAREYIEVQGGSIRFESEENKGTLFRVTFDQ